MEIGVPNILYLISCYTGLALFCMLYVRGRVPATELLELYTTENSFICIMQRQYERS